MTGVPTRCRASSRIDAGVHALGLPVLFETDARVPLHGFRRGLNGLLPPNTANAFRLVLISSASWHAASLPCDSASSVDWVESPWVDV